MMRLMVMGTFLFYILLGGQLHAGGLPPEAKDEAGNIAQIPLADVMRERLQKAASTEDQYVIRAVQEKAIKDFPAQKEAILAWVPEKIEKPVVIQQATPKAKLENLPKNILVKAPAKPVMKPWWKPEDGEIEAAANYSFGNSEEKEYFLKTSMDHKWGIFENTLTFEMQSSEEEGVRTEEEYMITNQTRHNVDDRNYNFLEIELEKDRFSGIQSRVSEFLGRGHTFTKRDNLEWKGEAAGGMTHTKFTDRTEDNSPSARLTSRFNWDITEQWKYKNLTKSTVTQEQIFTEFNNSIETKLTDTLKLRAAVDVDHDTEVPADKKETDVETRIGVVYGF